MDKNSSIAQANILNTRDELKKMPSSTPRYIFTEMDIPPALAKILELEGEEIIFVEIILEKANRKKIQDIVQILENWYEKPYFFEYEKDILIEEGVNIEQILVVRRSVIEVIQDFFASLNPYCYFYLSNE